MTGAKFVRETVKKIHCGPQKKKDIEKQLLSEINERVEAGENIDDILADMGSSDEIAASFNDCLSEEDIKLAKRNAVGNIIVIVMVVLGLLCFGIYFWLPKSKPIDESKKFNEAVIEELINKTLDCIDQGNYLEMQEFSTERMDASLNNEVMDAAKAQMSDDWGERMEISNIYIYDLSQLGKHYAYCLVTVGYENVLVTYTITFNEKLELEGLYLR